MVKKSHPVRHSHHVSRLNRVLLVAVLSIGFMFYVSYGPSNSFTDDGSAIAGKGYEISKNNYQIVKNSKSEVSIAEKYESEKYEESKSKSITGEEGEDDSYEWIEEEEEGSSQLQVLIDFCLESGYYSSTMNQWDYTPTFEDCLEWAQGQVYGASEKFCRGMCSWYLGTDPDLEGYDQCMLTCT